MSEVLEKQGSADVKGKELSENTFKLNQGHLYEDERAKVREQMSKGRLDDQRGLEINSELPDFLKNPSSRISEKQGSADVKEQELSEDERAKARELKLKYLNCFHVNSYSDDSDRQRQRLQRLGNDPHFDIFFNSSRQFHLQKNGRNN